LYLAIAIFVKIFSMFSKEIYIARRNELKRKVGHGLIVLMGNQESGMNYKDNWYHFRQDSSFLYYVGLDKAGLALAIDVDADTEILLGNDPSIEDIVWMGTQPSIAEDASTVGISQSRPYNSLASIVGNAQFLGQVVHFLPPYRPENIYTLSQALQIPYAQVKEAASVELIKAVVAQRSIKSADELAEIHKAVNVSNQMHLAAMQYAKAGMTEKDIAGHLNGLALSSGGNTSYPIILTVNGQTLHNHPTQTVLQEGQLVLCDAGAETPLHYAGDLTRTFPVSRKFTGLQKEVYDIVLASENAAVAALQPGRLFRDIHLLACEYLVDGLKQLGLMKGDAKEAVQQGAHALFFQCGLGHMMGLDVHDMEDLGEQYVGYNDTIKKGTEFGIKSLRLGKALEPGFVLTVEPGLYFIPELMDLWQSQNKFKDFINYDKLSPFRNFGGVRIEENFVITENGYQLLGDPLIKTAAEVEAVRNS
jgi:Xaa-Pro aminopeptidase